MMAALLGFTHDDRGNPIGTSGPIVEPLRTTEIKRHFVSPSLYQQPIAQGWECPKCGQCFGPHVRKCDRCGQDSNTTNDPGPGGKP